MTDRLTPLRLLIEVVVIVGSILLAFAIDTAWDNYQESRVRAELLKPPWTGRLQGAFTQRLTTPTTKFEWINITRWLFSRASALTSPILKTSRPNQRVCAKYE